MATGVTTWSKTAASNATVDSAQNWAEGMAPSAVNDSARGGMASVAKWRDDLNGSLVTSGTSTAYTVSTNQVFAALAAGLEVAFAMNATNTGASTLNVDSLGAKPLRAVPGVDLLSGVLISGTPYRATYYTSNSGEWILHGISPDPATIPLGASTDYWGTTAPNSSFAFPYGQAISRTTYAALYALLGTTYGVGDGSTTFNLPDCRGRVIAGKDNMGGTAVSLVTTAGSGLDGVTLGAKGGAQNVTLDTTQIPAHTHANTLNDPGHKHSVNAMKASTTSTGSASFVAGTNQDIDTTTVTTGVTITNASVGGGLAHGNVQPTIIANKILRVI